MDIVLALSGGGSKGNAHLGVLKVLEREGFRIRAIAGTSIGGLIGAVYLCGFSPDDLLTRFKELDSSKFFGHEDDEEPSILGMSGASRILTEMLGDKTFEDLPVPFAVTAVDLNSGQPVVISEGRLVDAVLATIALPGIFPARNWGEHLLIDGGVINPVPVNVARSLASNLPVVAVVLNDLHGPPVKPPMPPIPGPAPVIQYLSRLRVAQALNVFLRSMDISGRMLTELRLELDKPDVILWPDVAGIGMLDKVDVVELAQRGEAATEAKLDDLRRVTRWPYRVASRLGGKRWVRTSGSSK